MARSLFIRLQQYGVAVSAVALSLILTLLLRSLISPTILPLFFVAVAFSTWYGGLGSGLVATLGSVLAARYFLIPPLYTVVPLSSSMLIGAIAMLLVAFIVYSLDDHLQLMSQHHRISQVQLRRGSKMFRAAVESSFDAVYLLESVRDRTGEIIDFRFIDLNERGARLVSLNKQDILHQKLCELLPVNRSLGFFEKYKRVVETGTSLEEEFSTVGMPGVTAEWLHHQVVPLEDGITITSRDITERKQAEIAIATRGELFRTLAENSPDVIARMDREFRHLYVNSAITKATGLPPETFVGKTLPELGISADIYQPLLKRVQSVFNTGQPQSYEFDFPATDGTRYYLARLIPEFNSVGDVATLLSITSDITDLKRIEQALRTSENRFRRVLESNMIGMGFWDPAGNITLANDALLHMIGYTQAEVQALQVNWKSITPPEYEALEAKALQEIAETGYCAAFEKELMHKQGTRIPVLTGGAAFEDQRASGVFFVIDLSERKAIEKERDRLLKLERAARETAEAANRVKDEFLTVLSHELRTPLNPILGWTKLLQSRQFNQEQTVRALQSIERNARLQAELVDDLLDVSRILRGKLNLTFCPVNVVAVVEAAIATIRLSAEAKAIHLELNLDADTTEVLGNQLRLQQVVWNLLSNAIKFTPQGGRVTVSVQPVAGFAQIQVSDTGRGIDSSFLPHIFDYFRQSDGSITRTHGGLGLGLAIARHLVELHGGTIEAASPGVGQGAIFTVQLPLVQPEQGQQGQVLLEQPRLPVSLSGVSILVVENDADSREFVRIVLEQAGAQVTIASTVGEALRILAYTQPRVLISDIGLPDEDGYSLMQQIQFLEPDLANTMRAIALTAFASDADQQTTLAAGYHRHLAKPVEPDTLINAVASLI
ncbi:MAG: PAS domain S-box protein [Leptolyngbyaceae cyanobacterium bins.302]|nr:PAS domain S-box protein [Leptolyngbyaceae cyanobacterium bins.302]